MTFSLYQPKPVQVSVEEMERFLKEECTEFAQNRADERTREIMQEAKKRNLQSFGEVRARELALRLVLVSGGDILL